MERTPRAGGLFLASFERSGILPAMGDPVPNPPPGFDALSPEEKVDYVESLWGYVLDHSPGPLPEWQREIIEERLAAHRAHPEEARAWSEVRAELERKHLTVR